MANTVDKVLAIAEAEVGYLEKSKSAYLKSKAVLDKKTEGAGSDNYTKYGRDMHAIYPAVMDFPAAWCCCFCEWCFYKAYGISTAKSLLGGNFDDYTVAAAQLYKNKKAYYPRGNTPKVGDQIFFKNSTRICHTGLVYKVDSKYVYTIEGNTSSGSEVIANGGGVYKKKYLLTNTRIDGYGRPKYDVVTTTSTTSKSIEEIAQEVIDGKWGNNPERKTKLEAAGYNYDEVKNKVNELLTGKTSVTYFAKYTGTSTSITTALKAVGCTDVSLAYRKKIAVKNGIVSSEASYTGTAAQNTQMLTLLKAGKLIKP